MNSSKIYENNFRAERKIKYKTFLCCKSVKTIWGIIMRLEHDYLGVYVKAGKLKE